MTTELSTSEACILAAYRAMDRKAKGDTMIFVSMMAERHPEPPPPTRLRLVTNKSHHMPTETGAAS